MSDTQARAATFSDLGTTPMSDDGFVAAINATMAPGLALMNATCLSASRGRGEVVVGFELDERFLNVAGFICGGYLAHILDQTATGAATLVTGMAAPSVEFKTNFIAAARPGKFIATGWVVRAGTSIAFTEAKVLDSAENLIATAAVTSQLVSTARLVKKAVAK
jgi:uncharacterized protein (TIGR00369 family)